MISKYLRKYKDVKEDYLSGKSRIDIPTKELPETTQTQSFVLSEKEN